MRCSQAVPIMSRKAYITQRGHSRFFSSANSFLVAAGPPFVLSTAKTARTSACDRSDKTENCSRAHSAESATLFRRDARNVGVIKPALAGLNPKGFAVCRQFDHGQVLFLNRRAFSPGPQRDSFARVAVFGNKSEDFLRVVHVARLTPVDTRVNGHAAQFPL